MSCLLSISQQCCINVWIDNDSYIKASERAEEIKQANCWRRSAAVSRKLNVLLLLMESDLTVIPPCAHSSCSYLHNVGDIVNTGLINAGEHFKTGTGNIHETYNGDFRFFFIYSAKSDPGHTLSTLIYHGCRHLCRNFPQSHMFNGTTVI